MNSSYAFDLTGFKNYCEETYNLYVKEYVWFYMPVSMHKLLIHSSQIIPNFQLPIGFYTEEALEARNKDNKSIRLFHTRKLSRAVTMTDQFNRLLVTSDPIISTISRSFHRSKKKALPFPEDAAQMIKSNCLPEDIDESDDEKEDENEEETEENIDNNNNQMEIDDDVAEINCVFDILLNNESNILEDIETSDFYIDN